MCDGPGGKHGYTMLSMSLRVLSCIATVALIAALSATASAGAAPRFAADVAGAGTGPGHSFMVGDGLYLDFRDRAHARTRYRVCWTRGSGRRCWRRTTGAKGHRSRIFTAAPDHVGNYTATW
jgi:hypothetical protein